MESFNFKINFHPLENNHSKVLLACCDWIISDAICFKGITIKLINGNVVVHNPCISDNKELFYPAKSFLDSYYSIIVSSFLRDSSLETVISIMSRVEDPMRIFGFLNEHKRYEVLDKLDVFSNLYRRVHECLNLS